MSLKKSMNRTLILPKGEIHVWMADPDEIQDDRLLVEYRRILTDDERRQELQIHFSKDRHPFLVTRALVRTVLSRYVAISPEQWRFAKNEHGRPELREEGSDNGEISFNVAHTDGLIVCAVARATVVGIDTENMQRAQELIDIADYCFSGEEMTALHNLPKENQTEYFFIIGPSRRRISKHVGKDFLSRLRNLVLIFPACMRLESLSIYVLTIFPRIGIFGYSNRRLIT